MRTYGSNSKPGATCMAKGARGRAIQRESRANPCQDKDPQATAEADADWSAEPGRMRSSTCAPPPRQTSDVRAQPAEFRAKSSRMPRGRRALGVLAPAVLLADLRLLLGCEVVDYIKLLPDLFRVLALDHRRHLRARQVQ
eukprot:CAMPEP_0179310058 /NCGR_PEP_ID=MMETSP0797-20121207/51971_1 /TAXON_ID=47934 /ORGANISM="Dinophysis acuminata, Strain DAEP01" /LENGTH=139 /DNA_ID=CAMNT_0021019781 /DNA_START=20 /DNA_END=438 /DNA_ORIENTATION=+